jgi:hypothetical protein
MQHKSILRAGRHHSFKLQAAWNKYGEDAFEMSVIEEVMDGFLSLIEQVCIDNLKSCQEGYNVLAIAGIANRNGRITPYKGKKTHEVSVTPEGWDGAKAIAKQVGCSSVSELLEKIGRGELQIVDSYCPKTQ